MDLSDWLREHFCKEGSDLSGIQCRSVVDLHTYFDVGSLSEHLKSLDFVVVVDFVGLG